MFGLGADPARPITVVPRTRLTLRGGQVVFLTGASGGGKSTLLNLIRQAVQAPATPSPSAASARVPGGVRVFEFGQRPAEPDPTTPPPATPPTAGPVPEPPIDATVVDAVDGGRLELPAVLRILSLAGLNDAFVMLRRPAELSDGQRYRYHLAQAMASAQSAFGAEPGPGLTLVLADEFGATLDRTTAAALARNVRRWVSSNPEICFVAATTHDDLLEALDPDVLIEKRLGGQIAVAHRPDPSPPDEPEAQASGHDAEDRSR